LSELSPPGPRGRFLPPDPRVEEPYRLTPQAAARIAIVGVVAVVLFALLFFRLWALQVISGDDYLQTAKDNQVRSFRLQPPRGPILDRAGERLVTNVSGTVVQLWPAYTDGRLDQVVRRLSTLLDVPARDIRRQVEARADDPLTPVLVKTSVHEPKANYILEHRSEFPGVVVAATQLRRYQDGQVAAHLLGHVGEIDEAELARLGGGYAGGDRIGKSGIERTYDTYLRGEPGVGEVRVNAVGETTSAPQPSRLPKAGYAVRLTIDADLQRAAEDAIRYGIALAHEKDGWAANGGAIVAMNPENGEILALASHPTYDPRVFAGRADDKKYAELFDQERARIANYPLLNRAVAGLYPPGSVFKPVTALAAMAKGLLDPYELISCVGEREIDGQTFRNWNPYVNEAMQLPTALAQSCDTYFYDVALRFYEQEGSPLQAWARKMGFASPTGVDIGPEAEGLMPTPEWRRRTFADPIDKEWTSGDSVQLAIGQGDVLVTPLQMTRFYALLANGGKLVDPHLVKSIEQPSGSRDEPPVVVRTFKPRPPREIGLPSAAIEIVREGLYGATHDPIYGTATAVFGNFAVPVAGKTGTAEKFLELPAGYPGVEDPIARLFDQAWFCGYGPTDGDPRYSPLVVCALIENGGFGGEIAAPTAAQVFAEHWDVPPPEIYGEINSD
jgi:penicillin-binding protein 2